MKVSVLYGLVAQFLTQCTLLEDASTTILILLAFKNKAQIQYGKCNCVQSIDYMRPISKIMGSIRGVNYVSKSP
jgi:hypothetical protein